jgi:DNA-binding CsgD family transcriptional regulator
VVSGPVVNDVDSCDDPIDNVVYAVRRLADVVRRQGRDSSSHSTGILLDLQVDDVRCRLEVTAPDNSSPTSLLSPRETEVARMVAQGYQNKTIAVVLEISSFTVSSYLRRIFAKLGVNSRAAMVAQVMENGLLPGALARADAADAYRLRTADAAKLPESVAVGAALGSSFDTLTRSGGT